jgi:hypothetical protein
MTATNVSVRTITVDAALASEWAAGLGVPRVDRWRADRVHYRPEVRIMVVADQVVAAVLTSARPATAATKIVDLWWADGDENAGALLLDALIGETAARGEAALKWETPGASELPAFARERGFVALSAPFPSAAGTEGVGGWVLWLRSIPHTEPGYYAQTTLFTCGSVAALLAIGAHGGAGFSGVDDRDLELAFWRQASNFPACEPVGLAVALQERLGGDGEVRVALDADGPLLLEGFQGFERSFRAELQEESRRRAAALGISIDADRIPIEAVRDRVAAGELALLLIDEGPMHGETGPHWILAHAALGDTVIVEDPWITADEGETWVDTHELPVSLAALDRMVAWGPDQARGVVFLQGGVEASRR